MENNETYFPEAEDTGTPLGTPLESDDLPARPETVDAPADALSNLSNEAETDRLASLLEQERIASEYSEFSELFPGVSISALPDTVNESVRSGVPLAAAYALYHYKKEAAAAAAEKINAINSERSFALKKNDSSDAYFSPSEVKEMSPSEVKANYSKIIDSMSHWH